ESRLEEIGIQWRRDGWTPVQLLLVAAAVGEKELVTRAPVFIDAERHRGVALGIHRLKDEILNEPQLGVRMDIEEREYFFRYGTQVRDFIHGERDAPANETCGTRWSSRVEDLPQMHWRVIARIDDGCALTHHHRPQYGRKITCPLCVSR